MYKFLSVSFLFILSFHQVTFAFESKIQGIKRHGCYGFKVEDTIYNRDITDDEIEKFILNLKDAILKNDRKRVIKIANCTKESPCVWNKSYYGGALIITNSKIFFKHYNKIMTNYVKNIFKKVKTIEDICPGLWGFRIRVEGFDTVWFDPLIGVVGFDSSEVYRN